LWAIGLGREPGEFVFPPTTDVTVVQQRLQPRQRILVFAATRNATYAFMLGKENYLSWQLEAPTKIKANLVKTLHDFGQFDRNQPLGIKELSGTTWKDTASEILQQLTGNAPSEAWDEIDELVIVPDGLLWYIPFEALQIANDSGKTSLLTRSASATSRRSHWRFPTTRRANATRARRWWRARSLPRATRRRPRRL